MMSPLAELEEPISKRNLDGYGAPIIPWEKVQKRLHKGISQAPKTGGPDRHTAWLATVNPDGKPHVMPVESSTWTTLSTSTPAQRPVKLGTLPAILTASSPLQHTTST